MIKKIIDRAISTAIYVIFCGAGLILTMAAGRYVSKDTYADNLYILTSGTAIMCLTFYAISGIIRPRRR